MTMIGHRPTHPEGGCMRCRGFRVWADRYSSDVWGDDCVDFLCVDCDPPPPGFIEVIDTDPASLTPEERAESDREWDEFWAMVEREEEDDRARATPR